MNCNALSNNSHEDKYIYPLSVTVKTRLDHALKTLSACSACA
jgi:hypothetical protein